jgi:hypothetical protein
VICYRLLRSAARTGGLICRDLFFPPLLIGYSMRRTAVFLLPLAEAGRFSSVCIRTVGPSDFLRVQFLYEILTYLLMELSAS